MFEKERSLTGDQYPHQKSLINKINLTKTAYIIKDDKIEVEEDQNDL